MIEILTDGFTGIAICAGFGLLFTILAGLSRLSEIIHEYTHDKNLEK